MQSKIIELEKVSDYFHDGMSIMFGGFMGVGTPPLLVEALLQAGVKDLTLIGNDTSFPTNGVGPLISNGRAKKVIATHIGTNPETGRQMISGELDVELVPQGTLAEQIRAGGSGLGGVLTPTGVGTSVAEGKQQLQINGKTFLLEKPIRADLAIIHAACSDKAGNLQYRLSARNFNPLIALAADVVIAQADEIVEIGSIDPDAVMTPGALVDAIVRS
ncbi:acetate CoA-transferase subunit alpha [uncultured Cohaesibacter sp.]|uniref:acetate CoA-transferase subunit alpha n=1 Tax=uncultured Cohaesibacter sp. TaxID=1002546 RepID=UPI002930BD89|nr:acetate CoA-transferase subunit alpha [uncultured Cohaesibacter sp.]